MSFVSLQENLRKELRRRIRAGELTGMDLARRAGFTQAHVSNFLNGKRGLKLGALDRVLKAVGLPIYDLLDARALKHLAVPAEHHAEHVDVPLVDAKVAATSGVVVPADARQLLKVRRAFLDRLRPSLTTAARKSWTRFVAIEVDAKEAAAMTPLLLPRARLLLDRHYNSLEPYRKGEPNLYAVRKPRGLAVRYVEVVGKTLVLRPRNPEASVELLPVSSGNYGEMIVGRVVQIRLET
jgi:Helix-turn-helix domain